MPRLLALALTGLVFAPALAHGEGLSAEQILKDSDQAASNYKDLSLESTMIIKEPNAATGRQASFTTRIKGEKRLVLFTAPGDLKGMGFLVESRDTMYAYLPGFNRVRRLGTHMKNQTLLGSDVTNEEMAANTYGGVYAPKLVGDEAEAWILELTVLPGKEAQFSRLKVWVDKKIKQPAKIEGYDEKGKKQLTQTRQDWRKDEGGDHFTPGRIVFVNHVRNDHVTEIVNLKSKVNQGLTDDLFSQRSLVRGN